MYQGWRGERCGPKQDERTLHKTERRRIRDGQQLPCDACKWRGCCTLPKEQGGFGFKSADNCEILRQHFRNLKRLGMSVTGKDFIGSRSRRHHMRKKNETPPQIFLVSDMDDVRFDGDIATIWNWRNEE